VDERPELRVHSLQHRDILGIAGEEKETIEEGRLKELAGIAETLIESLPYIRRFSGRTMVVKYGGAAMTSRELKRSVMQDIALIHNVGINCVLVHGGGAEISQWMERMGKEPVFRQGLRVTDEETMELVQMTLCGGVNKEIAHLLCSVGVRAVGLSGFDAGIMRARKVKGEAGVDLGRVGEVETVDGDALNHFLQHGFVPVIATVAPGEDDLPLNLNADHAAGRIAAALKAVKLVVLTDVRGILARREEEDSLISLLSAEEAETLLKQKGVEGGMIPKVKSCLDALAGGVEKAHIIDGRIPHALLMEVFTDSGIGTMISRAKDPG
jgi:acetylglutamate kinase